MEGNHMLSPDIGGDDLLIGLLNAMMVIFFISGIHLSIFLPLILAIHRTGNAPNILSQM